MNRAQRASFQRAISSSPQANLAGRSRHRRPLGEEFQELVRGDLQVLRDEAGAGVFARLFWPLP